MYCFEERLSQKIINKHIIIFFLYMLTIKLFERPDKMITGLCLAFIFMRKSLMTLFKKN